ncbi:ABC transporter ATP-binding protein [Catenulispora sp. NL8]|uniref:ABC transporter ATP-binding protein n=1 Tax=Catenulispora pinistramenti TaxID=2705254 RepID=A0ABS5KZH4_9ACTN|nr:ABC transporter ATP-binding protein [Catenulispora pinistramenti]MBS2551324.1 ABC transporter ATP-binding protein [Catenulispora pinistramenti]
MSDDAVLEVTDLHVSFPGEKGRPLAAVRGLSYQVRRGETLAIVGESGSGKSVSSMAAIGLLPTNAKVTGSVRFRGRELLGLNDKEMSRIRGAGIAMVFQDPLSALTPVYRVGEAIAAAIRVHREVTSDAAMRRAVELLELVGIPDPARRALAFPHEFSGGMRQRVMIAMAIANDPDVIIADEPTTALDVTVQAQILEVLATAKQATGAAIVLITHDLGVVAGFADRAAVMYAGRPVETAAVEELFAAPKMPYTAGLLSSLPRLDAGRGVRLRSIPGAPPSLAELGAGCPFAPRCAFAVDLCRTTEPELLEIGQGRAAACHRTGEGLDLMAGPSGDSGLADQDSDTAPEAASDAEGAPTEPEAPAKPEAAAVAEPIVGAEPVLTVRDLIKHHPLTKGSIIRRRIGTVRAVDGVSLDIAAGTTLALVGESGSGKTTTVMEILRLRTPQGGSISVLGQDLEALNQGRGVRRRAQPVRAGIAAVFQDPLASLDPRLPVGDLLAEPLRTHGHGKTAGRVRELLEMVGLEASHANRFPREFSGGQRQRVAIARALALEPRLVVLDEPVSALDVSVRAGILNLLADLQRELGLAYLFVSHDLAVVRHVADRVAVLNLGRIVEYGDADSVFEDPRHPYTRALLSAVPVPDPVVERQRERIVLPGDPPSPVVLDGDAEALRGCRFRSRCPLYAALEKPEARELCESTDPALTPVGDADRSAACHHLDAWVPALVQSGTVA